MATNQSHAGEAAAVFRDVGLAAWAAGLAAVAMLRWRQEASAAA